MFISIRAQGPLLAAGAYPAPAISLATSFAERLDAYQAQGSDKRLLQKIHQLKAAIGTPLQHFRKLDHLRNPGFVADLFVHPELILGLQQLLRLQVPELEPLKVLMSGANAFRGLIDFFENSALPKTKAFTDYVRRAERTRQSQWLWWQPQYEIVMAIRPRDEKGQIQDFAYSEGAERILTGEAAIRTYKIDAEGALIPQRNHLLRQGDIIEVPRGAIYQIAVPSSSSEPLLTLQVLAPALDRERIRTW